MYSIATLFVLLPMLWPIVAGDGPGSCAHEPGCTEACTRLATVLGHGSFFIGNSNLIVWDAKQQERQSACRVQPATAEDVSKVLQIILDEGCRFAVKGGGHAQFPDDSISVGGVTIDLQKMRSIEVSADRSLAKLGSGHILYSLYSGLEKHNLTTLGGRVADVGLGGYALGGGLSSLSPAYGLAMDNVFEYELVLPNATIVNVNQDSHPDLYFALRGGMSNFGIVTHFTMRAVPQGQVYGGSRTFPSQLREEVLQQAFELTTQWKNDTAMAFYSHFTYRQNEDDFDITVHQEYARPTMDPPPFRQLNRLPSTSDNLRIDWTSSFSRESIFPSGYRNLFATATYQPSVDIDRKVQDILIEELQSCKAVPGLLPSIVTQPIYEEAIRANSDRGGSAAGLEAEGPLTVLLLTMRWNNEKDDATISALADRWLQRSLAIIQEAGKGNPWLYINYASKSQDPFAGYGEKNRQRLIAIQKEVDPRGTFTSKGLCRGNFKLR